jgi:hypothetical protein
MDEAKRQGNNARGSGDKISEITGKVGAVASQAKDEAVRAAEEEAIEAATKNGVIKAKKVKTPDLYWKTGCNRECLGVL